MVKKDYKVDLNGCTVGLQVAGGWITLPYLVTTKPLKFWTLTSRCLACTAMRSLRILL